MERGRMRLCVLGVVVLLTCAGAGRAAQLRTDTRVRGREGPGHVPEQVIVKFREGVTGAAAGALIKKHGAATLRARKAGGYRVLRVPPGRSVQGLVAALRGEPLVEYAEPNGVLRALMVPNDPYYSYQWHYRGPSGDINIEPAWDIQTGTPSVIVAVVDTGVAYEDFGRLFRQAPDLANTTFAAGYDFVNDDAHPNDDDGHGTHVAGTVAQSTNNDLGVAGVAFNCAVMPVKVLDRKGEGTADWVAQGIYFAADKGASVINLSLGSSAPSSTIEDAVGYACAKGVTVCAAAGNGGTSSVIYPAAYDDYVIAVGATRYDETRSYYSNYGSSLDLVAPGGDLNVDQNGDGYGDGVLQQTFSGNPRKFGYYFFHGTSMACPHVAGAAALLISNGVSGPSSVREALQNTAKDLGAAGRDDTYGHGLLDAYAALSYSPGLVHDVAISAISAPSSVLRGESATITVVASNPGDFTESFDVTVSESPDGTHVGTQSVTLLAGEDVPLDFVWGTTETTSLGDHTLTATAAAVGGETNLSNNSAEAVVHVHGATLAMHVDDIDMSAGRKGRSGNVEATAVVTVVQEGGAPVSGATVYGSWSGATSGDQNSVTNDAGEATFKSGTRKGGGTFTFSVTDVLKGGYAYDPAQNVETSDSITYP